MSERMNIFAYTEPGHDLPAYISINADKHSDDVGISVRTRGQNDVALINLPLEQLALMAFSITHTGGSLGFGDALIAMRHGHKAARKGWNGKGMWIVMMPGLQLPPHSSQEPGAKVNDRTAQYIGDDTPLDCQPYIAMWTGDGKWQPGWVCSQADMLASDWMIVG